MQTNNGKGPHKTEICPNGNLLIFTNTFKFLEPPLLQVRLVSVSVKANGEVHNQAQNFYCEIQKTPASLPLGFLGLHHPF